MRASLVLMAALAAWQCGCGVRTDPRPPEDTAPRPPGGLAARMVDGGVRLKWQRPTHSADGEPLWDLAGFVIERRPQGGEFVVIHQVPVTDNDRIRPQSTFTFEDTAPPVGMIFYRVRAFTAQGQHGNPCAPVMVRSAED